MPPRTSRTKCGDVAVHEKVESQPLPGEVSPVDKLSPALSTDERLDGEKLEDRPTPSKLEEGEGENKKGEDASKPSSNWMESTNFHFAYF